MHHHRVQQEKKKLNHDIEKLKALHLQYETKYEELSQKYAHAMKEKMLLKLERDRLAAKNDALTKSLQNVQPIKLSPNLGLTNYFSSFFPSADRREDGQRGGCWLNSRFGGRSS